MIAICHDCHDVGETINADCGHQVHRMCTHTDGDELRSITVCLTCNARQAPTTADHALVAV